MTVAALILPGAGTMGHPSAAELRRIAESAWAGGAWPLRIVRGTAAPDLLAGVAAATTAELAPAAHRTIGAATAGIVRAVRGTSAVLLWPADHPWVDPETVTLLLQAHGSVPDAVVRAEDAAPGVPILLPLAVARTAAEPARASALPTLLARLAVEGVRTIGIGTGDAGTTHDRRHAPADLPAYRGPDRPLVEPPDWGSAAADEADDPSARGAGAAAHPRSRR